MTLGARLEELIGHDAGGRGLARHADNLLTRSRGHLQGAATLLATAGETRPLIVTGFPILAADPPGTGETDGPPGALALARASVAAGGKAVLAAEGTSARALSVAVTHLRLKGSIEVVDLAGLPPGNLPAALERRCGSCTHIIAVERVGPTHTEDSFRTWAGDRALAGEYLEAAPPEARDPRWTRCQSLANPLSLEYWHMGDTTTRLGKVMLRSVKGVNIGGTARSGNPQWRAHQRSRDSMYSGSRNFWLPCPTR